ncbi:hypothetical protein ADUPG1_010279, partial [Aduncisulcus paluster]
MKSYLTYLLGEISLRMSVLLSELRTIQIMSLDVSNNPGIKELYDHLCQIIDLPDSPPSSCVLSDIDIVRLALIVLLPRVWSFNGRVVTTMERDRAHRIVYSKFYAHPPEYIPFNFLETYPSNGDISVGAVKKIKRSVLRKLVTKFDRNRFEQLFPPSKVSKGGKLTDRKHSNALLALIHTITTQRALDQKRLSAPPPPCPAFSLSSANIKRTCVSQRDMRLFFTLPLHTLLKYIPKPFNTDLLLFLACSTILPIPQELCSRVISCILRAIPRRVCVPALVPETMYVGGFAPLVTIAGRDITPLHPLPLLFSTAPQFLVNSFISVSLPFLASDPFQHLSFISDHEDELFTKTEKSFDASSGIRGIRGISTDTILDPSFAMPGTDISSHETMPSTSNVSIDETAVTGESLLLRRSDMGKSSLSSSQNVMRMSKNRQDLISHKKMAKSRDMSASSSVSSGEDISYLSMTLKTVKSFLFSTSIVDRVSLLSQKDALKASDNPSLVLSHECLYPVPGESADRHFFTNISGYVSDGIGPPKTTEQRFNTIIALKICRYCVLKYANKPTLNYLPEYMKVGFDVVARNGRRDIDATTGKILKKPVKLSPAVPNSQHKSIDGYPRSSVHQIGSSSPSSPAQATASSTLKNSSVASQVSSFSKKEKKRKEFLGKQAQREIDRMNQDIIDTRRGAGIPFVTSRRITSLPTLQIHGVSSEHTITTRALTSAIVLGKDKPASRVAERVYICSTPPLLTWEGANCENAKRSQMRRRAHTDVMVRKRLERMEEEERQRKKQIEEAEQHDREIMQREEEEEEEEEEIERKGEVLPTKPQLHPSNKELEKTNQITQAIPSENAGKKSAQPSGTHALNRDLSERILDKQKVLSSSGKPRVPLRQSTMFSRDFHPSDHHQAPRINQFSKVFQSFTSHSQPSV